MEEEIIELETESEVVEEAPSSSQIDTGLTLYDVNKNLVASLPNLTDEQIAEGKDIIRKFIRTAHYTKKFFMLLCNDLKYYTVIDRTDRGNAGLPYAQDEVVECLKELGAIKSIEKINDDTIECWITNEQGTYMLLLFPYDWGVIECQ